MRITTFPFGTLLSTVNFKKEEKDQWVRKPRQKFRRIVVGDGLVQFPSLNIEGTKVCFRYHALEYQLAHVGGHC